MRPEFVLGYMIIIGVIIKTTEVLAERLFSEVSAKRVLRRICEIS